tara:strand:- start:2053 stop:3582 length:1530 start_codon:yes stop_codon:yes gene_type:complete
MIDCLLVTADSSLDAYQSLSKKYSAIEPPTWSLLLAESCRSVGFKVKILDCIAEGLSLKESVGRIVKEQARVVLFVVYGQNPNAGTTSMIGAERLSRELKKEYNKAHVCFVGSHTSALPKEVLSLPQVDTVLLNEGVYALRNLLKSDLKDGLSDIKGIGWKSKDKLILNEPEKIVPQEKMDIDLPGYAWDLLPFDEKPLDLYRSHVWHANFNEDIRSPYAAIYTSLGCVFGCGFCMINIVNRTNNEDNIHAGNSRVMRFWSVDWVINQFSILDELGVKTVRISDEMFLLNQKYYQPICKRLAKFEKKFHIWAYSRIDTVRSGLLKLVKQAGIEWLALGIEAGVQTVRLSSSKGSFKDTNVRDICKTIEEHKINVISNFIVGLPNDNYQTMIATMQLALELNTAMMNVYPCMKLPGSYLYSEAKNKGEDLPVSYEEFAFLSYDSKPSGTNQLSNKEVIGFRDYFWQTYFSNPFYLEKVEKLFGSKQRENVQEMATHKLKRKLLEKKISSN